MADFKKPFRVNETKGVGRLRYYACPEGLIKPEELPNKWGLIYVYPNNKRAKLICGYGGTTRDAKKNWYDKTAYTTVGSLELQDWLFDKASAKREQDYLYSLAKRYKEQKFMDNIL